MRSPLGDPGPDTAAGPAAPSTVAVDDTGLRVPADARRAGRDRAATPSGGADDADRAPADGSGGRRRPSASRAGTSGTGGVPRARRSSSVHAGAWWLWALGLGTAATRTTNPLLLGLLLAVSGYVVVTCRPDTPSARSYSAFLRLALAVLALRLGFAVLLGSPVPGTHVLLTLPEVPLPHWAQGIRLGGRVTAEALVFALYDALRLAALLICVGAANALAAPARLLKSLPGALYEIGVAVVVALTFAPHLVADARRLRAARRLRGRPDRGVRGLLHVGLPVLESALERSVALAAAMDARGYGRTAQVPPAVRRTTAALTLGGLLGVCAGTYGLLTAEGGTYGLPVLAAGVAAALAGLWLGGRRTPRTRYRPDTFGPRSWLVAGSGVAVAALLSLAAARDAGALHPGVVPLTAPTLPLWPAAGVLLGLLPAVAAPAREAARPAAVPAGGRPAVGARRAGAPAARPSVAASTSASASPSARRSPEEPS
ncbi:energy-coupling factor transporter transmembrane protein EcfT [Streptomyces thermoviolaceus]|uniref:energy-coupling factor transporter transmembrane protein EcfT n=1 Tax=Streptomyces thermoviolaceus TaxID=1952 RepID=UPI00203F1EF6|nr:energy-coupling factor transporter transmembrane protein EcfT [Streptomyces thermoviolaceus]MCM3264277.1 energy-coupling factor transporter transmembrane protein EcfT [Streptomyces thermoviolaceus]WTD49428.1 energy-coupling factor transporter transmembrane protein EcfT [Streptomyces thermoviolaceus]